MCPVDRRPSSSAWHASRSVAFRALGACMQAAAGLCLARWHGAEAAAGYFALTAASRVVEPFISFGAVERSLRSSAEGRVEGLAPIYRSTLLRAGTIASAGIIASILVQDPSAGAVCAAASLWSLVRVQAESLKGISRPTTAIALEFAFPAAVPLIGCSVAAIREVELASRDAQALAVVSLGLAAMIGMVLSRSHGFWERELSGTPNSRSLQVSWVAAGAVGNLMASGPILIAAFLVGNDAVASLGLAQRMLAVLPMILGAVSAVHAREFALAGPARAHLRQARRQTRLFALPALVALLPAIFLVGRLVPALPGFELVAVCFAIGQVANVWFGPLSEFLIWSSRPVEELVSHASGLSLFCVLAALLTGFAGLGAAGVALSWSAGTFFRKTRNHRLIFYNTKG